MIFLFSATFIVKTIIMRSQNIYILSIVVGFLNIMNLYSDDGAMRILKYEDFSKGAAEWEPTDSEAWQVKKDGEDTVYALVKKHSSYKPPHRSPLNIALLKDIEVTDFEMTVRLRSTSEPYNHQSLCLFFGYQDPEHFYYVHFGKKTDDHANQIFIVNEAPRTKISRTTTAGTPWDDQWHIVRIRREVNSGLIEVFFDDLKTPVMQAVDHNFQWGRVGIGSFDDPGNFDEFLLMGHRKEAP